MLYLGILLVVIVHDNCRMFAAGKLLCIFGRNYLTFYPSVEWGRS